MLTDYIQSKIKIFDTQSSNTPSAPPNYDPLTHYKEIAQSNYYKDLLLLRHIFKISCDDYMSHVINAINVDMYMYTVSASSPMGPGSDSKPVLFEFGGHKTYLTDSAQFGFEPILLNGIDKAYSYLPSLRGEDADYRHLNQFYHTELELKGDRSDAMQIAEGLVKYLSAAFLASPNILKSISAQPESTIKALTDIVESKSFNRISFDDACKLLEENGCKEYINYTEMGRDISSKGELKIMELLDAHTPIWMTDYDKNRVAFYQKPNPDDTTKVLNADLLFPPIISGSFGGEIIGLGQRQDTPEEIMQTLQEQQVSADAYNWYIELRKLPGYSTTSGFGLGIERFLAWSLCLITIRDTIVYPRIKGEVAAP